MSFKLAFLCLAGGAVGLADVATVEMIIAKVNNEIITKTEIEKARKQLEAEMKQRGVTAENAEKTLKEREKDFLRDRIDQLLLVQKAKDTTINVDGDISKQVAEIQRQTGIADVEKFQAYVKEQTGMPFEDWKAEMKNGMLTQRVVRQEVGSRVNITKAEVQKFYEEHKKDFMREERVFLREILVSTDGKEGPALAAAEKKAKDVAARARKGERFGDLARDNSDSDTAKQFGELPPFKKGELSRQLEDLVWTKERGFITDPVKLPNGWLILRVEEHQKEGQAQLEEVENEIMERLYQVRMGPVLREYLTKLRTDAFLEIREGFEDSGAAPGKSTKWTDPAQLKPETITKEEVANKPRKKKLLWAVPIPGTNSSPKSKSK